jgi:penicillin V acylase-like amidase (Ntn superfamily)
MTSGNMRPKADRWTIIEENTIYNSPVHVLYIANSPKTTINANTFEGWNTIDKNNGTLSNSGRCFFVADEEITEGTVKALTSELSLSSNFIRDSYMALEVRIFYRNKESLDSTLSILGNVVEVPNGKWDLYGFSMLENTIIMNTYNRPYYPTNDQGKYYLEDGKFIVWDGEIWRNSDGTWSNRVVII